MHSVSFFVSDLRLPAIFRAWLALYILAAAGVAVSGVEFQSKAIFFLLSLPLLGLGHRLFTTYKHPVSYRVYVAILATYLWFGFVIKYGVLVNFSELSWISGFSFLGSFQPEDFLSGFSLSVVGILFLFLGLSAPIRVTSVAPPYSVRLRGGAQFFLLALIALKFYLQLVLNIARPGVEAYSFPIPFVGGFLAFSIGFYLWAALNVWLFTALSNGDRWSSRLAIFACAVYACSDLLIGVKGSLVLQFALGVFYAVILGWRPKRTSMLYFIVFIGVGVGLSVFIFKYLNYYRYALNSGADFITALEVAQSLTSERDESGLIALLNRVNGLENLTAALRIGNSSVFSSTALFDTEIVDSFNTGLYSAEEVATHFGLTQFGALYLVGGVPGLAFGGLFLGILAKSLYALFARWALPHPMLASAFSPLLAIWFMKLLFASGLMLLYMKEIAFLTAGMHLTYIFFYRKVGPVLNSPALTLLRSHS